MQTTGVSVAMPIHRCHPSLPRALDCVFAQDMEGMDLEVLLVLNGVSPETRRAAHRLGEADPRVRIIEIDQASLSAALNLALREARFELVARMDDDDECPPERLKRQAARLLASPELAGLGCAWELSDPSGNILVQRPPEEPAALRSRLLLGNCLAHGSMMLRRKAVLELGGYDESLDRAQDFNLWLRLSRDLRLACLPDVLYRYHAPGTSACSDKAQARAAAIALLGAWSDLPEGDDNDILDAMSDALRGEAPADSAREMASSLLDARPSRSALLAKLWIDWLHPPLSREAIDVCRLSRLREIGDSLRDGSVSHVWLWGAGNHAAWILDHRDDLGLTILGIVDDARSGEVVHGCTVALPDDLGSGECVIIASDTFENAIWERSKAMRARGVEVVRLYAGGSLRPAVAS